MKIGIIEDEPIAVEHLKSLILFALPKAEVTFVGGSIVEVVKQFEEGKYFDLIFADVELLDGNVFTAFEAIDIQTPVIFTTAYDEFMAQAFENNGIGYILKPYDKKEISKIIDKYKTITKAKFQLEQPVIEYLQHYSTQTYHCNFKKRFVIKRTQHIELLAVEKIVCIRLELSGIIAYDNLGKAYPMSEANLSLVEQYIDPTLFFRINRNDIVSINAIETLTPVGKDRVAVQITGMGKNLICSAAKTPIFKRWLEQS